MDSLLDEVRSVIADVLDRGDGSWGALQESGLLALAASKELGGEGLGLAEVAVILHEVGRRASDLPVWETLACGLLPLVRTGDESLQADLVPRVLAGELLLAPALGELGAALPREPATTYDGEGVTGTKIGVPVLDAKTLLVVSCAGGNAALVDPDGPGVTRVETTTSRGTTEATYTFTSAPALGRLGAEVVRNHAIAGLAALGAGLVEGARDLTAGYVRDRRQFGRPLAEFQAVAQQIADVYVASRTFTLTAAETVRRLDAGDPADDDLAVAAHWFADRASTVLQTCQHLHGGMGVDVTYPLNGYFSGVRDVARHLGGPAALADVPVAETAGKNAELTAEERAFKEEARAYLTGLATDADRDEMRHDRHGPAYHRIIKQMGADGWMGVGWPKEYGGQGRGVIEQQVFVNEAAHADVHLPSVTLQTVGPTLQAYGTQKQKDMFLADIVTGDVHFAIGYSEPDAGTDLASMRTSARRDGDHYVVNGQKMWTTGGHAADYVWLAVRTDPDAPPHRGISVLIVDTRDPGYSWTPITTSDGSHHTNATYYNDVRVPVDMLVGEENRGWQLITTQLNHERVMLGPAGRIEGLRDLVRAWAEGRTAPGGGPLLEVPQVRDVLARATASFRVNELINWAVARGASSDRAAVADASTSKVFASDEVQRLGLALMDVVATYGDPADPETGRLVEYLDATSKRNLVLSFGGGVNEVQRELIAMFGLDLPRVPAMTTDEEIIARTDEIKARGKSPARLAPDPVNVPMIRHWAEAIGDTNPRWAPGPDTEAPPAMAQVWTMYGLNPERMPGDPLPDTMQVLDDAGFTSVLGTNCDQTYARTLRPGEVPSISTYLADVVGPKKTGVGEGWFITTKSVWTVGDEEVATMTFRVLKFKPGTGRPVVDKTKSSRPMISKDTSFFWEGTKAGELRIQKCNACGELRHPPGPVCPKCHAMDRGYVVGSGKGTVRSFLVHHAPAVPGKQLPLTLALVDLEEGVRMIGEVTGEVAIGDKVEVWFDPIDDEVTLAKWRPAGAPDPEPEPEPESDLPVWELPITPTLVVSTALATRDFQDVHHDRDRSIGHGSKDIFINILSTTGLVQRYVTDWAGPQTQILSCALRLGAPAHPYDTLRFTGAIVSEVDGVTTLDVTAAVSIGTHANARLEIRR